MTNDEFYSKIKRSDKIDDLFNYAVLTLSILGGFFFLNRAISEDFPRFYVASLFLLTIGIYGIYRIPRDYLIMEILSEKPTQEKREIIEKYISKLKVIVKEDDANFYRIRYKNKFAYYVDLHVHVSSERFLVNAKCVDRFQGKGVFDFGISRRATKRAFNEILVYL